MGLSREQIENVRAEAEMYKAATSQVGKAMTTLWQARIDVAIAVGEAETVDDLLRAPEVGLWDINGSCRSGGVLERGKEVMNPIRK